MLKSTRSCANWVLKPDAVATELLIDGRNLLYRAAYANKPPRHCHTLVVALRLLSMWLDRFKPARAHFFWDADRRMLWRKKLLPEYKERKPSEAEEEVRCIEPIAQKLFPALGLRQIAKQGVEADDLIFAACRLLVDKEVIVCSTDRDFVQIVYHRSNVRLYDHLRRIFVEVPDYDPAIYKALVGDRSDRIGGYEGIGKVRGARLARSLEDRERFLRERGSSLFVRNMILVDLSLCPDLLKNLLFISRALLQPVGWDKDVLLSLAHEYVLTGLVSELSRLALSCKLLT